MDDDPHSTEQYSQRLCRAVGLVAIGAMIHTLLPLGGVLPIPGIPPATFVHAELRMPMRALHPTAPSTRGGGPGLSIEHTIVVPWRAAELDRALVHDGRDPVAVGTTGQAATLRPASLTGLHAAADDPLPVVVTFSDERATEPNGAATRPAPPEPLIEEALPTTPRPRGSKDDESETVVPRQTDVAEPAAEPLERLPAAAGPMSPVSPRSPLDLNSYGPVREEELVRRLLDEYTGAFERLDVGATKAMWPSVDDKALERAYGQLSAQRLTLQSCGITISGSTANARCRGSATYQPRIGRRSVEIASREWTFDLSKKDTAWRIVNTFVR